MLILKGAKDEISLKLTARVRQDNGRVIQVPFMATYRIPPASETKALIVQMRDEGSEGVSDDDLVDRFISGWDNLTDADGEKVEFTPDNLSAVMDHPDYRAALVEGMIEVVFGKKALAKN